MDEPANGVGAARGIAGRVRQLFRTPRRGRGFWYGLAIDLVWPLLMTFTIPVWRGGGQVPRTGGALLASNHISFVDPIAGTAFVLAQGRIPRYLAKASLWRVPLIRRVLAGGGHIPVHRESASPMGAYTDAVAALDRGETVLVYPEGTFTSDEDGWPMRGKTGVARMALATGVPVIPIAQWGGQLVLPRRSFLPRLLPRKTLHVVAGLPVDLSDLVGQKPTRDVLAAATERIMAAITDLLAGIRDETPPGTKPTSLRAVADEDVERDRR
jgi:1-acyl-sn-glycerol-3-phosphate acyltransferase